MRAALLVALLAPLCACKRAAVGRSDVGPAIGARLAPPVLDERAPRDGGTLRVHVDSEPPSLNPLLEHDQWTTWIALGALYDPLVRDGREPGTYQPALAERYAQIDDRTLRFTLRAGVTWSDGVPFDAADVLATFERLRDEDVAPEVRAGFRHLAGVEQRGPREIDVRFDEPQPLALQAIARLAILPAHLFASSAGGPGAPLSRLPASRAPVGTGPLRFVSWETGRRIVLARNERSFHARPHVDRVELVIARDREAAYELFRRGELDLVPQLAAAQVDRALADAALAGARVEPWLLPRYGFIVWNTRRPGLGDARVRRALTMLVDRERFITLAYRGRAKLVTGPYPLDSPSYDRAIAPWPFDPARARALLDEAGVRDGDGDGVREIGGAPFRIAFTYNAGSPALAPLATMLQEDFARAGVRLEARPLDWAAMLDRLRQHDFDAASLLFVMEPIPDNDDVFHSSQAARGQNYGAFRDPEADRLLEALRVTPLGPARVALDHAFHQLVHREQPLTFLGNPELDALVAARVHGFAPRADDLGLSSMWLDDAPPARAGDGP